jgi:hypothetical protein
MKRDGLMLMLNAVISEMRDAQGLPEDEQQSANNTTS